MKNQNGKTLIGKIIYIVILLVLIFVAVKLFNKYSENNFNDFVRTEYVPYTSEFKRDSQVKYSKNNSYKITSEKENDAMFYKEVEVTPNTPYKVTCMVKTQDVKTQKEVSTGGAHISIADTVEKSKSVTGTNDWQKIEFMFNSKNRTTINIGFRLGGYDDNCTGTAWFSDFTMESGYEDENTNWNVACFVFTATDVQVQKNGQPLNIKLSMTTTDVMDMKQNIERFKTTCSELTNNKMSVSYDFITINTPITSLSYDDENGYFVGPENVESMIEKYVKAKDYDHIFVCMRLGDNEHNNDIQVNDWIGLGGMDYLGVGFSNIRLPNSDKSYIYKYDASVNTFPEEVFLHEFLHSLERNAKEYGYERPELHDYAKYGYKDEKLIGLKNWYKDYMNATIRTTDGYIGLNSKIYSLKPVHDSDFEFSYKIDAFNEPQNIIEEIKMIFKKAFQNINTITMKKEENTI